MRCRKMPGECLMFTVTRAEKTRAATIFFPRGPTGYLIPPTTTGVTNSRLSGLRAEAGDACDSPASPADVRYNCGWGGAGFTAVAAGLRGITPRTCGGGVGNAGTGIGLVAFCCAPGTIGARGWTPAFALRSWTCCGG